MGIIAFPDLAFFAQYGWMGVPAFFVISGFVISFSASATTPSKFLAARILRLGPAVWLCAPLTAIFIVLSGQNSIPSTLGRLFNSMAFFPLGSQIDGVYWTLSIEVAFYTCVFLILIFSNFSLFYKYICLIATISATFNILINAGYEQLNFSGKWTNLLLIRHGCEFAVGALAYHLYHNGVRLHRLIFLTIAIVGSYAETASYSPPFFIWTVFLMVFAVTIAANGQVLRLLSDPQRRLIRELGKATYPLYLVHQIVGVYLLYLLVEAGMSPYAALTSTFVLIFTLTGLICWAEERMRDRLRPSVIRLCDRLVSKKRATDFDGNGVDAEAYIRR
ncbi:hypothetical protein ASE04_16115 [Rhizobium sp. Root708]|nr:hypothetical protein ASE04_16115 [Rhizobium sp. Root708]